MNNFIEQINETLYDYKDKIKDISIDNIDVKNKILLYIKNTIDVFQELNAKELEDNEKFVSLLSSYLKLLNNFDIRNINFMIKNQKSQILHYFSNILDESRRLNFISSFSNSTNTAVIVGSNGSGKSTFVNSLSGSLLSNLTVIPAQKMLYFSKSTASRLTTSIEKYKSEYLKSTNNDFKLDEQEYDSRIKLFLPFTFMITALVNDLAQFSTNQRNDTKN